MDFFSHQERARRQTSRLVTLFCLAVVGIIAAIYTVVILVFAVAEQDSGQVSWWNPELFAFAAGGTLLVVGLGSLYKTQQLRAGGSVIAQLLGGRQVLSNTTDHAEKTLINVVEEISVASGVPVPEVYVLDNEAGINAFAAGFTPSDAVIGVTRGCLEQFNRDELQGVIAHEFSHIFNGDMRLNLRLIGVLHGILCVGLAGYVILRSGTGFRHRGGKNSAAGGVLILGISLVAIGFIGMFFSRLIQAAVSRQREFLADASAVQFTRNPKGIGGALKKIGGLDGGSRLESAQAQATSHMFFGNAVRPTMMHALATHPPIDERIRRIDKSFKAAELSGPGISSDPAVAPVGALGFASSSAAPPTPSQLVEQTGNPTDQHLVQTRQLLESLPLSISAALHEPFSARAMIYALLLDRDATARKAQIEVLRQLTDPGTLHEMIVLGSDTAQVDLALYLPLVDLAMPALREMSEAQYRRFSREVVALIEADKKITLFEFTMQKVLLRHLSTKFHNIPPTRAKFHSVRPLLDDCQVLLSRLARVGHDDPEVINAAYEKGMQGLPSDGYQRGLLPPEKCTFAAIDRTLDRINRSTPPCKQWVLRACSDTVAHDGIVERREAELLRAIADTLDCPMPPLLLERQVAVGTEA